MKPIFLASNIVPPVPVSFGQSRQQGRLPLSSALVSSYKSCAFLVNGFDQAVTFGKQTFRSLQFWRRVLSIWATFKFTQLSIFLFSSFRSPEWPARAWNRQHHLAADMMLNLCTSMKGFYVKAGQLIALQAFVPPVIRNKLSALHDDMPHMSSTDVEATLAAELRKLGHDLSIFEPFDYDKSVVGSASIAQVHRATLKDYRGTVAIKLQHPRMEHLMMADLANFRVLGEILQRTELKFDLIRPIQELRRQLCLEFDFVQEAHAMHRIHDSLARFSAVTVPLPLHGLASRSLLVMNFIEGTPLTRLANVMDSRGQRVVRVVGRKLLRHLADCYGKMILTDGYFQADCHPGNILITNSKIDIGLLDFGQTKRLTEDQRVWFARLVYAMARRDAHGVAAGMDGLGIKVIPNNSGGNRNTSVSESKVGRVLTLEEKLAYTMFDTAAVPGVSDNPFSTESALRSGSVSNLPKDLMFLLRTIQILKGICKATYNDKFSMAETWKKTARNEIRKAERRRRQGHKLNAI